MNWRGLLLLLLAPAVARADDAAATREFVEKVLEEAAHLSERGGDNKQGDRKAAALYGRQALDKLRPLLTRPDADAYYLAGLAHTFVSDESSPHIVNVEETEKAIACYEKARALAPGRRVGDIAASIADLQGKLLRFAPSIPEYDIAIAEQRALHQALHQPKNGNLARLYGNSAEALMGMGDLDEAITRYRLAAAYQSNDVPAGSPAPGLPYWGLAVALDRDGQIEKGRAAVRRALELDSLRIAFDHRSVYFVPKGDDHYYKGMAFQESGKLPEAAAEFRLYLEAQPKSQYAARAREHLAEIARLEKEAPATKGNIAITIFQSARDPQETRRVVDRAEPALRTCLQRAASAAPIEVEITLAVRADGRISNASVDGTDGKTEGCLATVGRALEFPTGAPEEIRLTLRRAD